MADITRGFKSVPDLTTQGIGVHPDADPLVVARPRVERPVPGIQWTGMVGRACAVIRLPRADKWNGKLMIGATPAVRSEYSLDLLLSDIVLQHGYAYAACDKGTPLLTLRNPERQITEWPECYYQLTQEALKAVQSTYGTKPSRVYISGVSNGGYVTRVMLERHPELFDGGVEWEGVMWSETGRHLLTYLPVYLENYPIYCNWRGDRTDSERHRAFEQLLDAGLHPLSEPHWSQYFMVYWIVSLWLYGRNLDPEWEPFRAEWSNEWLSDPTPLFYPWAERQSVLAERIRPIANSGQLTKPLLSVAGNWDCLVSYQHHAAAYSELVKSKGCGDFHRMYEINRGNHVEGFLRTEPGNQQPVHPFYEAAIHYLEEWVEQGSKPPSSGVYDDIRSFAGDIPLFTVKTS